MLAHRQFSYLRLVHASKMGLTFVLFQSFGNLPWVAYKLKYMSKGLATKYAYSSSNAKCISLALIDFPTSSLFRGPKTSCSLMVTKTRMFVRGSYEIKGMHLYSIFRGFLNSSVPSDLNLSNILLLLRRKVRTSLLNYGGSFPNPLMQLEGNEAQ